MISPATHDPTPRVRVRRLRESDRSAFRALRLAALAADPAAFGSSLERESRYTDDRWSDWVRRGATSSDEATWVAEELGGPLVGMIGVFRKDDASQVWGLWVAGDRRHTGIGAALLDALLAWTRSTRPGAQVRLEVAPSQKAAIRLYRARGFLPTGKRRPLESRPEVLAEEFVRRGEDARAPAQDGP